MPETPSKQWLLGQIKKSFAYDLTGSEPEVDPVDPTDPMRLQSYM